MSEFSRSLRRQLTGQFPKGNPLVSIGVSAQILDLGLTEDELYDYITKDVARRLVMRFHPDRVDPNKRGYVELIQQKHANAYEELQNRDTFTKALAEFRNLKAEERNESRVLRQALQDARQMLESYREKERSYTEGKRQIERDGFELQRKKAELELIVPILEDQIGSLKDNLKNVRELATDRRKRFVDILRYVSFLCHNEPNGSVHAFDAKWVIVAGPVLGHAKQVPIPTTPSGKWSRHFKKSIKHLKIPTRTMRELKDGWEEASLTFNSTEETDSEKIVNLRLHVLELQHGKPKVIYGWEKANLGGRIIGSMPSTTIEVGRREMVYLASRDTEFEHLVPFLCVGGLLVSEKIKKIVKTGNGKGFFPFVKRETRQLILAVG